MTKSESIRAEFYARVRARNPHKPDPTPLVMGGQSHSDADELASAARIVCCLYALALLAVVVAVLYLSRPQAAGSPSASTPRAADGPLHPTPSAGDSR